MKLMTFTVHSEVVFLAIGMVLGAAALYLQQRWNKFKERIKEKDKK